MLHFDKIKTFVSKELEKLCYNNRVITSRILTKSKINISDRKKKKETKSVSLPICLYFIFYTVFFFLKPKNSILKPKYGHKLSFYFNFMALI